MFERLRKLDEWVLSYLLNPAGPARPRQPARVFLGVCAAVVWVATFLSMSDWLG